METLEAYLKRKHQEIVLLNGCLSEPLDLEIPRSVTAVVEQKFRLAAALKAQHALDDWKFTETNWAHGGRCHSGPFWFQFDYQRADLNVEGPAIYNALSGQNEAVSAMTYTSSGMAAISALLVALERLSRPATLIVIPGSYSETIELVENFGKNVQLRYLSAAEACSRIQGAGLRIILLDSCLPRSSFAKLVGSSADLFDLIVFDTTCFSTSSGNIRRVLNWASRRGIPVVLVRSHTKLDSLGVEYGRLGSVVTVTWHSAVNKAPFSLQTLAFEMRKAVRLFGGAAVPAHFPPFVGAAGFRSLSTRRLAAIICNNRRMAARLAVTFPGLAGQLEFAHSLYVTLAPYGSVDEQEAKQIADALCSDLSRQGLPIRHAGSFGFDFATAEWFRDTLNERDVVRIAMSDLPTELADTIAVEIMRWWRKHEAWSRTGHRGLQSA